MKKQYNQPRVDIVCMEPKTNILYAASLTIGSAGEGMIGD